MRKPLHYFLVKTISLAAIIGLCSPLWAFGQGIELGGKLPMADRAMQDAMGAQRNLAGIKGERGTVVAFWSNQCPWIDRYEERVLELASEYEAKGFGFALINANDPEAFPQENPEASQKRAKNRRYAVSYFTDEGSELARALGALRTPQVFVFDESDNLIYSGGIDDSPGDAAGVQQAPLKDALDAALEGREIETSQTKAFGCTIKPVEATG